MQRVLSAVVMLVLALVSSARGDSREMDEKTGTKDPLPRTAKVEWDVRIFEESPSFKVVKREVKGNRVTWVLENQRNLGTEIVFGYQLALFDEDGVKLTTLEIGCEPFPLNLPKGERNRFTLYLPPEDKLKELRKAVIKNGAYR
jgi:hypothetical protein